MEKDFPTVGIYFNYCSKKIHGGNGRGSGSTGWEKGRNPPGVILYSLATMGSEADELCYLSCMDSFHGDSE